MIDVLVDLRQYPLKNYYVGLAEQLDDAIIVAAVELRNQEADPERRTEAPGGAVLSL